MYGFDHLGETEVRCIDCGESGPIWRLNERERKRHQARHEAARARAARAHLQRLQREAARRLRTINRLRQEARR